MTFGLIISLFYYNFLRPRIDHIFRRRKYDYQKLLARIPQKLNRYLDIQAFSQVLLSSFSEFLYTANSLLLIKDSKVGFKEIAASGYEKLSFYEQDKPSKVILKKETPLYQYLENKPSILEREQIQIDPAYERIRGETLAWFAQASLEILIPLGLEGKISGLLGLGKRENLKPYDYSDLKLLEEIKDSLALILENVLRHKDILDKQRLAQELELASQIQEALIPQDFPHFQDLRLKGFIIPAQEIGGDYYDIIFSSEGEEEVLNIVIGDVSGKGVSAALVMAMTKIALRMVTEQKLGPKDVLIRINKILYEQLKAQKFITLLYLQYRPLLKKLIYASAGHEHILVLRKDSSLEDEDIDIKETFKFDNLRLDLIKSGGVLLGMLPDVEGFIKEKKLSFSRGDKLLLYTDGATEARREDGERFGLLRLKEAFKKHRDKDIASLTEAVYQEIKNFVKNYPQFDDIALLGAEIV